ncbi:MAG: zinc ribbon domain-containing protein, partial [Ruminococcus sp.]|nr:zinc ribbon domain-containing protein [Ruminococcus sp.]
MYSHFAERKENCKFSGKVYPLSGKIKCGKCGCSFKRKMINKRVFWTCSKHDLNASDCEIKPISQ